MLLSLTSPTSNTHVDVDVDEPDFVDRHLNHEEEDDRKFMAIMKA